jgi:hypothetical protein
LSVTIPLSKLCFEKPETGNEKLGFGERGRNRTCNRRIRNPMLYPFELRAHICVLAYFSNSGAIPNFHLAFSRCTGATS